MRPRRETPKPAQTSSYARLYDKLLATLTYSELAWGIAYFFLGGAALIGILIVLGFSTNLRNQGAYPAFGFAWVVVIAGMALGLIVLVVSAHLVKPETRSTELAACLLALAHPPRQRTLGLLPEHIRRVQRFAEIEQAAADWRGHYANIIIVATALAVLGAAPGIFALLSSTSAFVQVDVFPPDPDAERTRVKLLAFTFVVWLWFAGSLWLLWRMFHDIRTFLTREVANRTLLFACEEALALLAEQWLDRAAVLEFERRRTLIEQLGYSLVKADDIPRPRGADLQWHSARDADGERWALVTTEYASTIRR